MKTALSKAKDDIRLVGIRRHKSNARKVRRDELPQLAGCESGILV
jgi:hypothetical protein